MKGSRLVTSKTPPPVVAPPPTSAMQSSPAGSVRELQSSYSGSPKVDIRVQPACMPNSVCERSCAPRTSLMCACLSPVCHLPL